MKGNTNGNTPNINVTPQKQKHRKTEKKNDKSIAGCYQE